MEKEVITPNIAQQILSVALKFVKQLVSLELTQALIIKENMKLDRIDLKLLKEAQKLNKREILTDVKQESPYGKRKGSITYRSYSIEFKKNLIASIREQMENTNANISKIVRQKAQQLGIHPKNINRWYHTKQLKKKQGGRKALFPEMQLKLATFIDSNPTMKRKLILAQAKKIMSQLCVPGKQQFNFSKGWYERFRDRYNKNKIKANVKLEDGVKTQVKHEQSDDEVKKQQYSEDEFVDWDEETMSDEDNVKLEEELSLEEEELNIKWQFRSKKLKKTQKMRKIQFEEEEEQTTKQIKESLYFESEESNHAQQLEDTTEQIIKQEQQKLSKRWGQKV